MSSMSSMSCICNVKPLFHARKDMLGSSHTK